MTDAEARSEEELIAELFPPVLTFVGPDDRFIPGIPMRDLAEPDIERIVRRRTVGEREDRHNGHAPGDAEYAAARRAAIDQLASSQFFAKPAKTKKSTEEPDTAPADAAKE